MAYITSFTDGTIRIVHMGNGNNAGDVESETWKQNEDGSWIIEYGVA